MRLSWPILLIQMLQVVQRVVVVATDVLELARENVVMHALVAVVYARDHVEVCVITLVNNYDWQ